MLEIKCKIPVYETEENLLSAGEQMGVQTIVLSLKEGKNVCKTQIIILCRECKEALEAEIAIPYEYDKEKKELMISAPHYQGEEKYQLILKQNNVARNCALIKENEKLGVWSKAVYKQLFCEIMKKTEEEKISVLIRDDSEMFRNNTLGSTYGGPYIYRANTGFWNVMGSTPDPHKISWIEMIRYNCLAEGQFGVSLPDVPISCHVKRGIKNICNRIDLVGAHIVVSKDDVRPHEKYGSGPISGVVRLLPICRGHNNVNNVDEMKLNIDCFGLWLNGYQGEY